MPSKQQKKNQRNRRYAPSSMVKPPPFMSTMRVTKRFRYVTSGSGAALAGDAIQITDLLDAYFMAATTTTGFRLWRAVKVEAVEMWCSPSSVLAAYGPTTVFVEWPNVASGAFGSPSVVHQDTTLGLSEIAHVRSSPPADSVASKWLADTGSAFTIFALTGPPGTVVDITLSFAFADDEAAESVTRAVAGATAGKVYLGILDQASAAKLLIPVGYNVL